MTKFQKIVVVGVSIVTLWSCAMVFTPAPWTGFVMVAGLPSLLIGWLVLG